jgi:hypothetical protein
MVIRRALSVGSEIRQPAPGIRRHGADIPMLMQACVRDPFRVLMPTIPAFVLSSTKAAHRWERSIDKKNGPLYPNWTITVSP